MSQMFVRGVAELAEAYVSVKRLQSFLESDEVKQEDMASNVKNMSKEGAITVKNFTANWNVKKKEDKIIIDKSEEEAIELKSLKENELSNRHTLRQIDLNIRRGCLIGVVGPVGSGNNKI